MSGNRFWLWGLLVAAVAIALWYRSQVLPDAESIQSKPTRVVFVTGGDNNFWQLTTKGAEAAAREHNAKLKTEIVTREGGLEQQTQVLLGLNEDEVDGCAVSPLDAQGQTLLINRLARKMNVVTYDSDAPVSERQYYIGTSNYLAGKISHELVREAIPEGGKIAVFLSNITKDNMLERKTGYEESEQKLQSENPAQDAAAPVWQTVEYFTDEGDKAKSQENIAKALEEHEDIACLVGMNAYQAPLLLEALEKAGKLGKIKVVAFDELDDTLDGIEAGRYLRHGRPRSIQIWLRGSADAHPVA